MDNNKITNEGVAMVIDLVRRLEERLDKFESKIDTMQETINIMLRNYDRVEARIEAQEKMSCRVRDETFPRVYQRIENLEGRLTSLEGYPSRKVADALKYAVTIGVSVVVTAVLSRILG